MATISDMQGQCLTQGLHGRNACDAAIHPDGSRDQHRAGVD